MSTPTLTAPAQARSTTVAAKVAMAVSGLFFVIFVLAHMYGNLKMFAGAEAYNDYAHHLRVLGDPYLPYSGGLWILRVLLLVALIVHVAAAAQLWRRAKAARGTSYTSPKRLVSTYSSRTMRWGGIILLVFIVFHLLQYTTLTIQIGADYGAITPYERMVAGFANPFLYLFYLVAMILLAMHVRHGVWSALTTLGANRRRRTGTLNAIAIVVAVALVIGFMIPPTAILLGWIS